MRAKAGLFFLGCCLWTVDDVISTHPRSSAEPLEMTPAPRLWVFESGLHWLPSAPRLRSVGINCEQEAR